MNTPKLFLDEHYTIDGVTVTGEEIRDNIIEAHILKRKLSHLLRGDEE